MLRAGCTLCTSHSRCANHQGVRNTQNDCRVYADDPRCFELYINGALDESCGLMAREPLSKTLHVGSSAREESREEVREVYGLV